MSVASHVLKARDYLGIFRRIATMCPRIIIVADSSPEPEFLSALREIAPNLEMQTGGAAIDTHMVMRESQVLVTANSQFGLVAAALQSGGISFVPTQWFAPGEHEAIESALWRSSSWLSMVR